MGWGKGTFCALLAGAMLWLPAEAPALPPVNDQFANRETLSGPLPIEVSRSNVGATKEGFEEVNAFGFGHTVWFEWQAPGAGFFTAGTCGAPFHAILGVFTGSSIGALTRVTDGNGSEGPTCQYSQSQYTFKAAAGGKYEIGVDGNGFHLPESPVPVTEGEFPLRIEQTPLPANDDLAKAAALSGSVEEEPGATEGRYYASRDGFNWNATTEAGEPQHGLQGGASVWYSWTAPASGTAKIDLCCWYKALVAVYSGSSIGSLQRLAATESAFPEALEVPVAAGTTYRIAVDGRHDQGTGETAMGSFSIRAWMSVPLAGPTPLPPPRYEPPPAPAVDSAPPGTTISSRKISSARRRADFRLVTSEAGGGFRCRIDRKAFSSCGATKTYRGLGPGRHSFAAVAVDAAGNADPTPAVAQFTIRPPRRP